MNRIKEWWAQRSGRERTAILLGALLVAVSGVLIVVLTPESQASIYAISPTGEGQPRFITNGSEPA